MNSKKIIQSKLEDLKRQFGEWTYDIPLSQDVWTRGNLNIPHTRLKRIVQIVHDLCPKPISECRVLDLGCLEGIYSIEFALRGAETIGMDVREANLKKAIFCKEVLQLQNLTFIQDDVRNLTTESLGTFDVILCCGILYHLTAKDAVSLLETMFHSVKRLLIVDTHVALEPEEQFLHLGIEYYGKSFREHSDGAIPEAKAKKLLASWDNPFSFWFTRPSLINLLQRTGFSSVYECFIPPHINYGKPGVEHRDRCTFVAIKDQVQELFTSPATHKLQENWPENSLSYAKLQESFWPAFHHRILLKMKRFFSLKNGK